MERVFVTGGTSYIGAVLIPKLLEKGYEVVTLVRDPSDHPKLDFLRRCKVIKGDIRDMDSLNRCLEGVNSVIHLAAISNDPCADLDPELAYEVNVRATENLINLSKSNGVKRFIYASSSGVYGLKDEPEVTEDLSLKPLTTYSKTKAIGEEIVINANKEGFITTALRAGTTCGYSPSLCLDLTVNLLTMHALTKGEITIFGGNQKRPCIHIDDITDYYRDLLTVDGEKIAGQVFNASSQNNTTMEVANFVKEVLGESIQIKQVDSDDKRSYHISSDKIKNVLGFYPKKTIKDAVAELKQAFDTGMISDLQDPHHIKVERMKKKREEKKTKKPERVLIIKTGYSEVLHNEYDSRVTSLGDILRTTPILHLFKDDYVTWVTDKSAFPILEGNPYIDRLLSLDWISAEQLKEEHFDVCINLEKDPGICVFSDKINAWKRYGFRAEYSLRGVKAEAHDNASEAFLISSKSDIKKQNYKVMQELLFEILGKKWVGEEYVLGYKPQNVIQYDVCLNNKIGAKWPTKAWPTKYWDLLEKMLIEGGFRVTRQDKQDPEVFSNLYKYMDWINSSRLVVSNDSLGMHLGIAMQKKVLGLFGATFHVEVFFHGRGKALFPKESILDCVPCFSPECKKNTFCMDLITPNRVYDEIKNYLQ